MGRGCGCSSSAKKSGGNAITEVLQPFVERRELAGAVTLAASKDKILSLDAVGFADLAAEKRMRTDALFWIASQTKPMTCTALMMLVEEGQVNAADPVEKYLPEFKGQLLVAEKDDNHVLLRRPAHPITVREILSHTAGLPFISPLEGPALDLLPLNVAVRSHAITPLVFEPGSQHQYSNAGTNTAGRIIEVVSGQAYEDFMQERLLGPLGMQDTTFWPDKKQAARLAKAYTPNEAKTALEECSIPQLTRPYSERKRYPMPAGGLFSTVTDVARFCQMILSGGVFEGRRYLSEKAISEMTSKQTGDAVSESYGFGWRIYADDSFGHGGAFGTGMTIFPKRGLIAVFHIQHNGFLGNGGEARAKFVEAAQKLGE